MRASMSATERPPSSHGHHGGSHKMSHSATMPASLHRKGGSKKKDFGSRRSSSSPKHGRPGSAPNPADNSHRKPMKLTIRDIVDNDSGKRPTSKNLIKGLEDNVRKVLEMKRGEYDKVHYTLKMKRKELADLELQLADLTKDGQALGLDDYPDDRERLQPVSMISTRKVFTKHTRISNMVAALEDKKHQIQSTVHTGQIYDHMRHRLMQQRVQAKAVNRDLKIELRKKQIKNKALTRDELAVSDSLGVAQTRLAQLKKRVERDLALWRAEIADLEGWTKQKSKFETFVNKQVELQREIEMETQGDAADAEEEKSATAASMFANRHSTRKLNGAIAATSEEEKRYEEAFRSIGIKLDSLDPKTIIDTCMAQDEIRKDLLKKRAAEEERLESLKQQLAQAQGELQQTIFDQERTTNRVLSDREKELQEAIKQLEAERSEFQFMQATVQPVKIGIQHLAKKVLDVQVDLSDIAEIEWVMNQIQQKLARIIEETRQDGSSRAPAASTPAPDGTRRASLSLAGLADAEANASWLMSPFNCRVRPSHHDGGDEEEEAEVGDTRSKRKGRRRMKGEIKEEANSDSDSDEDPTSKVFSRHAIKRMSDLTATKYRKRGHRAKQDRGDHDARRR